MKRGLHSYRPYMCTYTYTYTSTSTSTSIYLSIYLSINIYIYIYICLYACFSAFWGISIASKASSHIQRKALWHVSMAVRSLHCADNGQVLLLEVGQRSEESCGGYEKIVPIDQYNIKHSAAFYIQGVSNDHAANNHGKTSNNRHHSNNDHCRFLGLLVWLLWLLYVIVAMMVLIGTMGNNI